jgi:hypothetical protein
MPGALATRRRRSATTLPTHAELSRGFRILGAAGARRATGRRVLVRVPEPLGHRGDIFERIVAEALTRKVTAKRFNAVYRAALDAHDEVLSTSSVREMVFGSLEEHTKRPLSAKQIGEINEVIDNVSRARLPTNYVGYSVSKTERMQHPTSPGAGLFAESSETASGHAMHDRARRSSALDAAGGELRKNPSATYEQLARAATRAAIAYTLNDMAAPATAEDVKPFSRVASRPDSALTKSVQAREDLKAAFVKLGGVQEVEAPGATPQSRLSRRWAQRRGAKLRTVSPPRLPRSALTPTPA